MKKTVSTDPGPIEINLRAILRKRLVGWKGKLIPGFLIGGVEKLICQEQLNDLLRRCYPRRGSAFSSKLLDLLGISLNVEGLDNLPDGEKFIFASNHPLGGLDGIALTAVLGREYGDDNVRVVVNDMLLNVEPLREMFLPVNKYGSQAREATRQLTRAFAEGKQILMFPAGLVSRLQPDGSIADLEWKKSVITQAEKQGRRIVPVRFMALNRPRFYKLARLRKKLGIGINLEQVMLPSELCNPADKEFTIKFGQPIRVEEMEGTPQEKANTLRKLVHSLR